MSNVNLGYWLRKTPQPVAILADDKRIDVPRNARAWKDLTATIQALEPSKLTCLDGSGNVIRSIVLESDDDKADRSPEMTDLQFFARLLADAYDKGSKATQPVIENAMQFLSSQAQRLLKAESEIDRLRAVIHRQHMQIAELSGGAPAGTEETVLGALVAGALQGAAGLNTNGAAKPLTAAPQPQPAATPKANGAKK